MKKGEKRLLIFGVIVLLLLLINSFVYNVATGLYLSLFVAICLVVFKVIFGFEKSKFRVTKEVILDTLIIVLIYLLAYYLFGLIIGFVKTGNYYTVNGFKNYIIPLILTTTFKEILRFNYLTKADRNKRLVILSFVIFVFIDITNAIYYGVFIDNMHIFKFLALTILPALSYNIYATYTSMNAGYKSIIIYGILVKLYTYLVPIVPNADEYLTSILSFLLPVILLYRVYTTVKNESDEKIHRDYNKKDYISIAVSTIIVIVLVYFSSGYFTYHAIAIATGSMAPSIKRGDVVIVKKTTDFASMEVGEVFAYEYHGVLVVHRIAKKVEVDGEYFFYSKGDSNQSEDNYIIKQDMIEGVVKARIPLIGMPTVWLNEMWEE